MDLLAQNSFSKLLKEKLRSSALQQLNDIDFEEIREQLHENSEISRDFFDPNQELDFDDQYQNYIYNLSNSFSALKQTFAQLNMVINLLNEENSINLLKEYPELEPHEWITYQIENFYLRAASIFDKTLIMVNEVYCLGLRPKDLHLDLLTGNKRITDCTLIKSLEQLDGYIGNEIKQTRNKIAHETNYNSKYLQRIETSEMFKRMAKDGSDRKKKIERILDYAYRDWVENETSQIKDKKEELLTKTTVVLEELCKPFKRYESALS